MRTAENINEEIIKAKEEISRGHEMLLQGNEIMLQGLEKLDDLTDELYKLKIKEKSPSPEISLRPQKKKVSFGLPCLSPIKSEKEVFREVAFKAYNLRMSPICFPDHEGIYPRINYLPGSSALEVYDMFKYGYLNSVYLSKDNEEITLFPKGVINAVNKFKDYTRKKENLIFLKILTACPVILNGKLLPASHIIQIGHSQSQELLEDQSYKEFSEDVISEEALSYKRALGYKVLYETYEKIIQRKNCWIYEISPNMLIIHSGGKTPTNSTGITRLRSEQSQIYMNRFDGPLACHQHFCRLIKHEEDACKYCRKAYTGKSSQQELKERFENGDPEVGLLGEESGKFDYYVKYSKEGSSSSQRIKDEGDSSSSESLDIIA